MSEGQPVGRLGNVVIPVDDLDLALPYYTGALGLTLKFRDGGRWAALDGGGVTIGLAGPEEHPPEAVVAISFRVDDVAAAVTRAAAGGAEVVLPPTEGEHEVRALVRDRDGNQVYFYSTKPRP